MSLCRSDRYENLLRFLGVRECAGCGGTGYTLSYGCQNTCENCRGQGFVEHLDWCVERKLKFTGQEDK